MCCRTLMPYGVTNLLSKKKRKRKKKKRKAHGLVSTLCSKNKPKNNVEDAKRVALPCVVHPCSHCASVCIQNAVVTNINVHSIHSF